jgi:dTDP-4-amino-4,6-dideoxygalactose transaminase
MKTRVDQLALFGGEPEFAEPVHVGRPHLGDRRAFLSRVDDMLDRRWLANEGPYLQELERRIAEYTGVAHCIVTCNGTTALQVAARASGLSGEVLVPAFTFVATAHALLWQGITPVLCDVDPVTHNLDPAAAEELVGPRTTGILAVHLWGRPCNVEALSALADRHGLRLIIDASHAFACFHDGRMVGAFGDAEVFSLHATKLLNAFEGGAITTNDDELAAAARLVKNFGFTDYDEISCLGINGKMSEVSAAMGLSSLESLDEFIARNRANYLAYRDRLEGAPGLSLVPQDDGERRNYQHVVLEIDEGETGLSRDALHRVLWAENVLARRYFYPGVHRMEPYRSADPEAGSRLPVTEHLAQRTLALPNGGELEPSDVARICDVVEFALAHGEEIAERLVAVRP